MDQTQRGKRGHALIGSVEKGVDSHGSGAGRWEEGEKGRRGEEEDESREEYLASSFVGQLGRGA